MMEQIGKWWNKPAMVYEFWLPRSGFLGGVGLALLVALSLHLLN